jgi:hypothetical protein
VEALNTPTIRRLTPSCRHQLSALALGIMPKNDKAVTIARGLRTIPILSIVRNGFIVMVSSLSEALVGAS